MHGISSFPVNFLSLYNFSECIPSPSIPFQLALNQKYKSGMFVHNLRTRANLSTQAKRPVPWRGLCLEVPLYIKSLTLSSPAAVTSVSPLSYLVQSWQQSSPQSSCPWKRRELHHTLLLQLTYCASSNLGNPEMYLDIHHPSQQHHT